MNTVPYRRRAYRKRSCSHRFVLERSNVMTVEGKREQHN
jgi:hypothetical protein